MDPNSKILVTGGTGFIGSRLVAHLVEQGHCVNVLSRRADPPTTFRSPSPFENPNVNLVIGDITDAPSIRNAMQGCAFVFHLAAYAKNWAPDSNTFFDLNVQGTRNVLDAAVDANVRKVVFTSSIVTLGPTRKGEVANESTPRSTDQFFTEYEESKTIAENEALAENRVPVVVVNPTRVYGPGQLTESNSLVLLIDDYDRGKVPFILNNGVNVGNYVFVDDVVDGHLLAMNNGRHGERYILGGENTSLKGLFRIVDSVSGKSHFQIPVFRPGALAFAWIQKKKAEWLGAYPKITPGWVRTFMADWAYDCDKAINELGYQPRSLESGIRETYHWLQLVQADKNER